MADEPSIKLTYEDYLRIPYDGKKHEIINGVHYVSDAHYTRWQRVTARLKTMLHQRPDFCFRNIIGETARVGIRDAAGVREFLMEIVTDFTKNFDEDASLAEREEEGVLEWWVIRPKKKAIRIYRRIDGRLTSVDVPDPLTTPLLPDFELRIKTLFS
jgi:Putative restriction endonuclease